MKPFVDDSRTGGTITRAIVEEIWINRQNEIEPPRRAIKFLSLRRWPITINRTARPRGQVSLSYVEAWASRQSWSSIREPWSTFPYAKLRRFFFGSWFANCNIVPHWLPCLSVSLFLDRQRSIICIAATAQVEDSRIPREYELMVYTGVLISICSDISISCRSV